MDQVKKLHQENNVYPDNKKYHLVYQHDKKLSEWKFMGYRCVNCHRIIKRVDSVPKHSITCTQHTSSNKYVRGKQVPISQLEIKTVDGKKWEPYDSNQKLTDGES